MTIEAINKLSQSALKVELEKCCGAGNWVAKMAEGAPYKGGDDLLAKAESIWMKQCSQEDWLEAFTHHPKIGDIKSLARKFANTKQWAGQEQAGVNTAGQDTLQALAKGNEEYEKKFGYIFIVCATGKTAAEMLDLLEARLPNDPATEIKIAMAEQDKITKIRLRKLIDFNEEKAKKTMSQITTHVLDTSLGKPGQGILIQLQQPGENGWTTLAQGVTDSDGRIANLLEPDKILAPGNYQMVFDTGGYFAKLQVTGFYPEVAIQFTVFDNSHYHVPLLINPYGYSTYRGS